MMGAGGNVMHHLRMALVLTALGGLGWVSMAVPLPPGDFTARPWVMPIAGVFLSFLLFATIVQARVGRSETEGRRAATGGSLLLGAVVTIAGLMLTVGVAVQKVELIPALLVYLTGFAALLLVGAVVENQRKGEGVGFTTHWGGLGGSLGGWNLSPAAVFAVLAIFFIGVAAAIGLNDGSAGNRVSADDAGSSAGQGNGQDKAAENLSGGGGGNAVPNGAATDPGNGQAGAAPQAPANSSVGDAGNDGVPAVRNEADGAAVRGAGAAQPRPAAPARSER